MHPMIGLRLFAYALLMLVAGSLVALVYYRGGLELTASASAVIVSSVLLTFVGTMIGTVIGWAENVWIPLLTFLAFVGLIAAVPILTITARNVNSTTSIEVPNAAEWLVAGLAFLISVIVAAYLEHTVLSRPFPRRQIHHNNW